MATMRAKREINFSLKNTPSSVGPGSYNSISSLKKGQINTAAFSSSAPRDKDKGNKETPGPGSYYSESFASKTGSEGKTFITSASRMAPVAPGSSAFKESDSAHTPAPGSYYTQPTLINSTLNKEQSSRNEILQKYNNLFENKKVNVPTIPRPSQSFGYEAGENGNVIAHKNKAKVYSGIGADTVGPAFYSPNYDAVYSNRGSFIDISRAQGERKLFEHSKTIDNWMPDKRNPGPGYYNYYNNTNQMYVDESKQSSVFASKVPNVANRKISDSNPGPGSYTIDKGLSAKISKSLEKMNKETSKAFMSNVDRQGWDNNISTPYSRPSQYDTPGPGSYIDVKTFNGNSTPKKTTRNAKRIPENVGFNSAGERDCMTGLEADVLPGPGSYDLNHESTSLKGKLLKTATLGRKGVFGTTTNRFFGSDVYNAEKKNTLPGPGQYNLKNDSGTVNNKNSRQVRSVFLSKTNRFTNDEEDNDNYDINNEEMSNNINSNNNSTTTRNNQEGGEEGPNTALYPFASSAPRFAPNSVFANILQTNTPGPGSYDIVKHNATSSISVVHANPVSFQTNDRRFKQDAYSFTKGGSAGDIGPGSYENQNLLIKKSFNVTIGVPTKKKKKRTRGNSEKLDKRSSESRSSYIIEFPSGSQV